MPGDFSGALGMPEQYDLLEDSMKNAEMIVFWSNDPDTTRAIYCGQDSVIWRQWLKEKGVKDGVPRSLLSTTQPLIWTEHGSRINPDSNAALALVNSLYLDRRRYLRQGLCRKQDRQDLTSSKNT